MTDFEVVVRSAEWQVYLYARVSDCSLPPSEMFNRVIKTTLTMPTYPILKLPPPLPRNPYFYGESRYICDGRGTFVGRLLFYLAHSRWSVAIALYRNN